MASWFPGVATPPAEVEVTQVAQMPLPPKAYYPYYTDENIEKGRAPKPPPPPATNENYQMFGVTHRADDAIIRSLESQGIRRLYPKNFDHRQELKKLNISVLTNFLDLLILMQHPESPKRQEKMDDMSLLFIHMHHLINEFRPHQARETLRVMMEVQKRQALETFDVFQGHLEKCIDVIKEALNNLPEQCDSDSQLLASTAALVENKEEETRSQPAVSIEDEIMCDIVDSM